MGIDPLPSLSRVPAEISFPEGEPPGGGWQHSIPGVCSNANTFCEIRCPFVILLSSIYGKLDLGTKGLVTKCATSV